MTNILISVTIFAITAFLGPVHSYYERCIGERCFTIPESNEIQYFQDARKWCKQRNSSLAAVNDNNTQAALVQFLNSAHLKEQPKLSIFIDLKLEQKDTIWYLVNGTKYLEGIKDQNLYNYWFYGYMKIYPDVFKAVGSKPNSSRNFICEFENTMCSNTGTSGNSFIYTGRCFIKYENERLTWFKSRERCRYNGGDLVTLNYPAGTWNWPYDIPFNTSWLNPSLSYWIGLRYRDWRWISSGDVDETIYSSWASDKPNNIDYECVCVDPNGNPAWGWTDCNCVEPRQFVCLKIVPTTIATKPASKTSSTVSFPFDDVTNSPSTSSVNNALIVGLVLGIAVILPLLIIILILVIIILHQKRSRERTRNNDGSVTQMEAAVAAPDSNYQHANRQTMFGPGSEMPHYDQLNPTENKDYELTQ